MNQGDLYNALTNGTIKVNTWFELLRRLCAGTLPRGECGWWSRPPPLTTSLIYNPSKSDEKKAHVTTRAICCGFSILLGN